MICGIYKIQNLINNKIYIGQSTDIKTRWYKHKCAQDDFYIHRALRKYGINNFSFDIIEECKKEELNKKEKYYINLYNSLIPNGYNMIDGGSNEAGLSKRKSICQYDLQGKYIQTYSSILEAERKTGINNSNISSCCLGKRKYAGNYQWRYEYNNTLPLQNLTLQKLEKENRKKIKELKQKRIIIQKNKENQIIGKFNSCTEASQITGIHCGNINSCCNGKRSSAGGFYWTYEIKE